MEAQQIEQQQYIQKTHQTNMYQMQNIFQQELDRRNDEDREV